MPLAPELAPPMCQGPGAFEACHTPHTLTLTAPSLAAAPPADAEAAAATAAATTAATPAATTAIATATTASSISAGPSGPPVPSAPIQPCAARTHAAAQLLPPRSPREPERGDLPALLPGRPIVANICVTQPLAASAAKATARDTGATAKGQDSLKRDKYSRIGTPCAPIHSGCPPPSHHPPPLRPIPPLGSPSPPPAHSTNYPLRFRVASVRSQC